MRAPADQTPVNILLPSVFGIVFASPPNFAIRPNRGTGLGLAIAKGIVTAHGGTIGVKSSEQWSSIFWIRLPIRHQTYPADRF